MIESLCTALLLQLYSVRFAPFPRFHKPENVALPMYIHSLINTVLVCDLALLVVDSNTNLFPDVELYDDLLP